MDENGEIHTDDTIHNLEIVKFDSKNIQEHLEK